MKNEKTSNIWGGRFEQSSAQIMQQFNESISFDKRLAKQDIEASIVHCEMLIKQKIIAKNEGVKIIQGLKQIAQEIKDNKFKFQIALEDIHMNVEGRLKEIIGDVAGKLHTARSRNDQVAVDFKLWIRDAFKTIDLELVSLQNAIIKKAEQNYDTIVAGFTHLQTAQPTTFGHHLMAYFEMFLRDRKRVKNAIDILNECPLGACALAGTSFNIDREFVAKKLGFKCPTRNSVDSVSDRDFVIEFLSVVSLIAMHLSRLSEEIVLWSSYQFQFIKLSDAFTTGSSIMPQKKNPDGAELVKGKTGRIFGALMGLLTVMKGLPLAYCKDMQEDKEQTFDAYDSIVACLKITAEMIQTMEVNKEKMKESTKNGFITATDLADWLTQNLEMPFRDAHRITGKIVKLAEEKQCELHELKLEEMQKIEKGINKNVFKFLEVEEAVNTRKSFGGTASENVLTQIQKAQE